jgi:hypothetical protein
MLHLCLHLGGDLGFGVPPRSIRFAIARMKGNPMMTAAMQTMNAIETSFTRGGMSLSNWNGGTTMVGVPVGRGV